MQLILWLRIDLLISSLHLDNFPLLLVCQEPKCSASWDIYSQADVHGKTDASSSRKTERKSAAHVYPGSNRVLRRGRNETEEFQDTRVVDPPAKLGGSQVQRSRRTGTQADHSLGSQQYSHIQRTLGTDKAIGSRPVVVHPVCFIREKDWLNAFGQF